MLLLRFIPEPYATLALGAAIICAYLYGSVTGTSSERTRNQVALLTAQNKVLTQDLVNASRIQQEVAQEASDARSEIELLKGRGANLAKTFSKSSGPCSFSNDERLRIERDIPIRGR